MANLKCRKCNRDFVRRVSRDGFVEVFLSVFYVYPFKCQLCGKRFRSFQRGVRYYRVERDRREYARMEIEFPMTFSGESISGEGTAINVAMGGCTFTTKSDLEVGAILKLELRISAVVPPVIVGAAVVRNRRPGIAGVEFLRWEKSERDRLQLFVRGLLIERGTELAPAAGGL